MESLCERIGKFFDDTDSIWFALAVIGLGLFIAWMWFHAGYAAGASHTGG